MVRIIAGFYGFLGLLALVLIFWRVAPETALFPPLGLSLGGETLAHLGATLVLIGWLHGLTRLLTPRLDTLRQCARDLREFLPDLDRRKTFLVAATSSLGEELFFRGWLLNEIGLLGSSLLFGLAHIPPNRNWLFWPLFAFAAGLLLGLLCLWTQSLLYAVLLHAGINYFNIRHIQTARQTVP